MKTAIIYASTHGTTEKLAQRIQNEISTEKSEIFNLKTSKNIDLSMFEQVIIGGSIHAGKMQKKVRNFCKTNLVELLQKRIGLFMCGMNKQELEAEFNKAFPELLRKHSTVNKFTGGEYLFDKMNFIEKYLIKKIAGVTQSISKINEEQVKELILLMKN